MRDVDTAWRRKWGRYDGREITTRDQRLALHRSSSVRRVGSALAGAGALPAMPWLISRSEALQTLMGTAPAGRTLRFDRQNLAPFGRTSTMNLRSPCGKRSRLARTISEATSLSMRRVRDRSRYWSCSFRLLIAAAVRWRCCRRRRRVLSPGIVNGTVIDKTDL